MYNKPFLNPLSTYRKMYIYVNKKLREPPRDVYKRHGGVFNLTAYHLKKHLSGHRSTYIYVMRILMKKPAEFLR